MIEKLRYGNTNTYFIRGSSGGLLVDTDYAGTLHAFYGSLKSAGLRIHDIEYVFMTHCHPDHMGLVGDLMRRGVKLLLADVQKDYIHFSDGIFARDGLPYVPIDDRAATLVSCENSRECLAGMGISGEIIHTPSHSPDSVSLILDSGDCFVGDLEPFGYLEAYESNPPLERDWQNISSFQPRRIHFAHAPERAMG